MASPGGIRTGGHAIPADYEEQRNSQPQPIDDRQQPVYALRSAWKCQSISYENKVKADNPETGHPPPGGQCLIPGPARLHKLPSVDLRANWLFQDVHFPA
ncbi:hypothetical protein SDC9_170345 [bioreactor metagenome]|uniref:Uncharacterized protein n=1 Tax=bioreactor metagenome TaxID=1076179 RepID=A0A645GA96_9ZZZZ